MGKNDPTSAPPSGPCAKSSPYPLASAPVTLGAKLNVNNEENSRPALQRQELFAKVNYLASQLRVVTGVYPLLFIGPGIHPEWSVKVYERDVRRSHSPVRLDPRVMEKRAAGGHALLDFFGPTPRTASILVASRSARSSGASQPMQLN